VPPVSDTTATAASTAANDPNARAQARVGRIHDRLLAETARLDPPALALFCAGTVRRHLAAAAEVLHPAAAHSAETRLLVQALGIGRRTLDRMVDTLAATGDPASAAAAGRAVAMALDAHLAVERTLLLPALSELPDVDLPALVEAWESRLGGRR